LEDSDDEDKDFDVDQDDSDNESGTVYFSCQLKMKETILQVTDLCHERIMELFHNLL
jgi:hypothetical protein